MSQSARARAVQITIRALPLLDLGGERLARDDAPGIDVVETLTAEPARNLPATSALLREVKQTVFRPARITLRVTGRFALAVQVAHASQFSWTYEQYQVPDRVRDLLS